MKRALGILVGMLLSGALVVPAGAVTVRGTLLYDKIPATPLGLDPAHPISTPAPGTHVQIQSADGSKTLADGHTDDSGNYQLDIPDGSGRVTFYALSEGDNFQVGPAADQSWSQSFANLDPAHWPGKLEIGSFSGPFNIVATLHKANQMLRQIEPGLALTDHPVHVFWTQGVAEFDGDSYTPREGTDQIVLDGDPGEQADEFNDSVILELYGGYLAHNFSRDDANFVGGFWGGISHFLREQLNPTIAWNAGWACFFAQAVLGNPVYVQTTGPRGASAMTLYLEEDQLDGDKPGYWSAYSVASTLWHIFADKSSGTDHLGLGLAPIWKVLRGYYPKEPLVSLLTMADGLIQDDPTVADGVAGVLASHGVDYHPGVTPPAAVPYPRPIQSGVPVTGTIDSTMDAGLLPFGVASFSSDDYYLVHKSTAGLLALDVKITGAPEADGGTMTLQVYDSTGVPVVTAATLRGVGSDSHVSMTLPAGTYVIGVLSYIDGYFDRFSGSDQYQLTANF